MSDNLSVSITAKCEIYTIAATVLTDGHLAPMVDLTMVIAMIEWILTICGIAVFIMIPFCIKDLIIDGTDKKGNDDD